MDLNDNDKNDFEEAWDWITDKVDWAMQLTLIELLIVVAVISLLAGLLLPLFLPDKDSSTVEAESSVSLEIQIGGKDEPVIEGGARKLWVSEHTNSINIWEVGIKGHTYLLYSADGAGITHAEHCPCLREVPDGPQPE